MKRILYIMLSLILVSVFQLSETSAQSCTNMSSRLEVGMNARVTPGPSNNVRSSPNSSATLVGQISGGGEFSVIGGPTCSDNYTWWEVKAGSLRGWTVEYGSGEYWVEPYEISNDFSSGLGGGSGTTITAQSGLVDVGATVPSDLIEGVSFASVGGFDKSDCDAWQQSHGRLQDVRVFAENYDNDTFTATLDLNDIEKPHNAGSILTLWNWHSPSICIPHAVNQNIHIYNDEVYALELSSGTKYFALLENTFERDSIEVYLPYIAFTKPGLWELHTPEGFITIDILPPDTPVRIQEYKETLYQAGDGVDSLPPFDIVYYLQPYETFALVNFTKIAGRNNNVTSVARIETYVTANAEGVLNLLAEDNRIGVGENDLWISDTGQYTSDVRLDDNTQVINNKLRAMEDIVVDLYILIWGGAG